LPYLESLIRDVSVSVTFIFPSPLAVFGVRKDMQNKYSFGRVIDSRYQPIAIAMNVEHRSASHDIRMSEVHPHVRQRSPISPSGDAIPVHKRR
jgi:hypothetical protein